MRTAYTEWLYITPQDRHIAQNGLNRSTTMHDGSLDVLYHTDKGCFSITSKKGGYKAVQRVKEELWAYFCNRRHRRPSSGSEGSNSSF